MRISLPVQIIIAIGLAIFCGIFFGEWMGVLQPVGKAFVMLLKMSILPYIMFALIHGIGSLHPSQAKRLLKYGGIFLVSIWTIVIGTILGLRFSFPPLTGMLYYSAAPQPQIERRPFLDLFIPDNIFDALSNNIVPAVVVFSLFFGAALMLVTKKETTLNVLGSLTRSLSRITKWIIQISPIGVFALIASTTGTLSFHQFEKIAIYLFTFAVATGFMTFWALPLLVTSLTNITYKELIRNLREGILLAFATGNIFVCLPYLIDAINHISKKRDIQAQEAEAISKTLVPIAYNLPLVGNLMAMLFILFLAYYYGIDFTVAQRVLFIPMSLLTLAGPVTAGLNSIAFMITELRLPREGIALFVETLSVTRNFQALAGAMGIAVFTILTLFAFTKQLRIRIRKLLFMIISTIILLAILITILYFIEPVPRPLPAVFPNLTIDTDVPAKIYLPGEKLPEPPPEGSTLARIRDSKVIRIGYTPDTIPFTYFNDQKQLVGYDMAYAYALAEAMDAKVEFIPLDYLKLAEQLDNRLYDIGTTTITVTAERLENMAFTDPTTVVKHVFVVLDYRRKEFAYAEQVKKMKDVRIAVLAGTNAELTAEKLFPNATIVPIKTNNDILTTPDIDAVFWADVEAITWVKLHPKYTIVEVIPPLTQEFYAYAIKLGDEEFLNYVNYFLQLQKLSGFQEAQYKKWILGELETPPQRWSIIRNVLHWVD